MVHRWAFYAFNRTLFTCSPAFVLVSDRKMSQSPCLLSLAVKCLSPLQSPGSKARAIFVLLNLLELSIPQVVSVPLVPHDLQTQSFQLGPRVSSSSALHMLFYQMNSLAVIHFGLPPRLLASLHLRNCVTLHALLSASLPAEGFV